MRAAVALLTPEQIAEVVANRVVIEQAKGMLMFIYDIGPDRAFDVLLERSQAAGVRIRDLAGQLTSELRALGNRHPQPERVAYDEVLHTVHQRIRRAPR